MTLASHLLSWQLNSALFQGYVHSVHWLGFIVAHVSEDLAYRVKQVVLLTCSSRRNFEILLLPFREQRLFKALVTGLSARLLFGNMFGGISGQLLWHHFGSGPNIWLRCCLFLLDFGY